MGIAGFAKGIINSTFAESAEYYADLESRAMYFSSDDEELLLIVLDLVGLSRFATRAVREHLSAVFKIDVQRIAIHATHTHTSPKPYDIPFREVGIEVLAKALERVVSEAISSAQKVSFAHHKVDMKGEVAVQERKVVEGMGAFTVWYGFDVSDGKADGRKEVWRALEKLTGQAIGASELPESIPFDAPLRDDAHLLVFKNEKGETMGSLVQYAVHPIISGHGSQDSWKYGPDFPGMLRDEIETKLGGICAYTSGPHADITAFERVSWKYDENKKALVHENDDSPLHECRRIAGVIAEKLLSQSLSDENFQNLNQVRLVSKEIPLPLRDSVLMSSVNRKELMQQTQWQFAEVKEKGATIGEIKALSEQVQHLKMVEKWHEHRMYFDESEIQAGELDYDAIAFSLNDLLFCSMPGESFAESGYWLDDCFPEYILISLAHTNGVISYVPRSKDFKDGSYHCIQAVLDPSSDDIMREELKKLVTALLQG